MTRTRSTTSRKRSTTSRTQGGASAQSWNGLTQAQVRQQYRRLETAVQNFGHKLGMSGQRAASSRGGTRARSQSRSSTTA